MVLLLGVVSVGSALFPPWRHRMHLLTEVLPPLAPAVAAAITVPLGLILIQPDLGTGMVFLLLGLIVIEGRLSEGQPVR